MNFPSESFQSSDLNKFPMKSLPWQIPDMYESCINSASDS